MEMDSLPSDVALSDSAEVHGAGNGLSYKDSETGYPNADILIVEDGDCFIDDEQKLPLECKGVLGRGLSAVVDEVVHKVTGTVFARKVIEFHPRRRRKELQDQFNNEVAIIRNLNAHLHVIRLFTTYTTSRRGVLLLQPAADEGDLSHYLDRYVEGMEKPNDTSMDLEKMTRVLKQAFGCLASGLAFMHERGIRHKDIKPGNILIHQNLVIYTDFGAANDTKRDGQCTTEGPPKFLTKRYSPPEVLEEESRNFAADVFSLGCVFIHMVYHLRNMVEPEELEDYTYSHVMEKIHDQLSSDAMLGELSFLAHAIKLMTARIPSIRPLSDTVNAVIAKHHDFSCLDCRRTLDLMLTVDNLSSRRPACTPEARVRKMHEASKPCAQKEGLVTDMSVSQPQPQWDPQHQRWILQQYDRKSQLYFWAHSTKGQQWTFLCWCAPPSQHDKIDLGRGATVATLYPQTASSQTAFKNSCLGPAIDSSHDNDPSPSGYERLDPSYFARNSSFFRTGKVFAVLFSEGAASSATAYNDSVSITKYGETVYSQIRRFIVIVQKRGFCYAVPIFTYGGQGTMKPGVNPRAHAIAFSHGYSPLLFEGESPLEKQPICIHMVLGVPPLSTASRIFFGIHHPIQYNVKVKDVGDVHPEHIDKVLGYWAAERDQT